MTSHEKLKIILHLSGLTQEKLAQKLDVSFATLNSWVRGRSQPHHKKQIKIENLYSALSGLKPATDSPLNAKKKILQLRRKKYKDVLSLILKRQDILDQFILSLTYNTNRIEGSTLTEPQTAAILFDNVALPNKTLAEHLEAKNHQTVSLDLLHWAQENRLIDETVILRWHGILFNGIHPNAGAYRHHGVRIVGSFVLTANYLKIPALMKNLIRDINNVGSDTLSHVTKIHSEFEKIHPFSDGNGRVGRLLMHAMLLKENYPPAIVLQKRKRGYLSSLNKSQRQSEFQDLEEFICDAVLLGFKILET